MKNYEVLLTGHAIVLVIAAENEDKAYEYAQDAVSMGDFEVDTLKIEREVPDNELAQAREHASCVDEDQ